MSFNISNITFLFIDRWLKRKNAEKKKYQAIERQKYKVYKLQMKRSKKSNAYLKSLNEQQAFQSIDYYGYRY